MCRGALGNNRSTIPCCSFVFFFQAEDGIRDIGVTGVQTCALPICGLGGAALAQLTHPAVANGLGGAPRIKKHHHAKIAKAAKAAGTESMATRAARANSAAPFAANGGTSANYGIAGGNQASLLLQIPVNLTHNALGLLGTAA